MCMVYVECAEIKQFNPEQHCSLWYIVHISSVETLETAIVYTPVLVGNHIQTPHCGIFVLYYNFLSCNMDVIYPQ